MGIPQLADLVLETANAPGTGAIILGGAPEGRQTFADAFPAGGEVFYYASDGQQTEWGIGTLVVGSPNTLARTKVLGNLFGTANALNFSSSITVWCEVPAQNAPAMDDTGLLPVSDKPDFDRDIALSAKVAELRYLKTSGGNVPGEMDWGSKTAPATVTHRFWSAGPPAVGDATPDATLTIADGTPGTTNKGKVTLAAGILDLTGNGELLAPDADSFDGQQVLTARVGEKRYAGLSTAIPIGAPQLWPLETPPLGWLALNGASFDKTQYPGLAAVYTSGVLPDMRGKFVRGWDNGASIDPNDGQTSPGNARALLSTQTDALQNITGNFWNGYRGMIETWHGAFTGDGIGTSIDWGGTGGVQSRNGITFDASLVARTSTETRPTNMAWNMIVRAA